MNQFGSGFIPILIYGSFSESAEQDDTLITEDNFDILTESGDDLLRE
jgi:hypothetical protein